MPGSACVIGIDFGTESGRAVVVDVRTGRDLASVVCPYPHGVLDRALPDGTRLGPAWALQDPADYIGVLRTAVPRAVRLARISPDAVIGIGTNFTSCTVLPTDAEGTPLSQKPEFRREPNAWVKLWKHHAAQPQADKVNEVARRRKEAFLPRLGGKVSSEWFVPKVLQTLEEAPRVYKAASRFIEGSDWIVWQMTGVEVRNACAAGYKGFWHKQDGYPSPGFFRALDPRMENFVSEKLSAPVVPVGTKVGGLTPAMAKLMGLRPGTPVTAGIIDAHAAVPGSSVVAPGALCLVMGTSLCHMLVEKRFRPVPGICGVVQDGIIPGYFGYEAGQAGGGDILAWFIRNCVPADYLKEAKTKRMDLYSLLERKAAALRPGQSGLVALDWLNGNRSVLNDADLSGLILGLTINTRPEEIYRALMESLAFGTRTIIENFERHRIKIRRIVACGGLPEKNKLLMQIFADVTGRVVALAGSSQTTALGSALFAAVAAGPAAGGYASLAQAAKRMARLKPKSYKPSAKNQCLYDSLYQHYARLYDFFGRAQPQLMKSLRLMKTV
jgi:L-ribulokinase